MAVRVPGACGRRAPAIQVTPDPPEAKPVIGVTTDPDASKPANEVFPDFGVSFSGKPWAPGGRGPVMQVNYQTVKCFVGGFADRNSHKQLDHPHCCRRRSAGRLCQRADGMTQRAPQDRSLNSIIGQQPTKLIEFAGLTNHRSCRKAYSLFLTVRCQPEGEYSSTFC